MFLDATTDMFSQQWDPGNSRECLQWLTSPQGLPALELPALPPCSFSPTHLCTTYLIITAPRNLQSPQLCFFHCLAGLPLTYPLPSNCYASLKAGFLGVMTYLLWVVKSSMGSCPKHFSCLCLRFLSYKVNLRLAANFSLLCGQWINVFKELGARQMKDAKVSF